MSVSGGRSIPYRNPVWPESVPDPSVILTEEGMAYCYGTPDCWADGRRRQIPILRSGDMVHWQEVGSVFEKCPDWKGGSILWACEIARIEEKYVLYYTLMDKEDKPRIGCAAADSPEGPFRDMGCLSEPEDTLGIWAIDPRPVQDGSGNWLLICGNYEQGTCVYPLSGNGLSRRGEARLLAPGYEGVWIVPHEGYYYLLGSLGSCTEGENTSYHVVAARSKDILGPYTNRQGEPVTEENKDREDLLVAGRDRHSEESTGSGRFIGPGNGSLFRDMAGDLWIILHAVDRQHMFLPDGGTKRVLCMEKLYWDEEGWPHTEGKLVQDTERPGPYMKASSQDFHRAFCSSEAEGSPSRE